jgi:dTDP-4-dehydrorhamnose 3,5-epimerase
MRFLETDIPGPIVIEPDVHRDARGFFVETFHATKYCDAGIPTTFVQDNHSLSVRNTLRGLHLQVRRPQGKLVRCVEGEIWDVAVDLRPESATFARWVAASLSSTTFRQLYIPPGFAHGFCVLSAQAQVEYKCTEVYDPEDETGIAYDDPALAIAWPVKEPLLSARDCGNRTLHAMLSRLFPRLSRWDIHGLEERVVAAGSIGSTSSSSPTLPPASP